MPIHVVMPGLTDEPLADEHIGRLVRLAEAQSHARRVMLMDAPDVLSLVAEIRHHRARLSADKERVRQVVLKVCSAYLSSQGIYGYDRDIANRVADELCKETP